MHRKETVNIKGVEIVFYKKDQEDFISLTDIAKIRDIDNPSQIISLWLRTYSTIEYLGLWEMLNNPVFKPHIYEGFKNESAKPHFWILANAAKRVTGCLWICLYAPTLWKRQERAYNVSTMPAKQITILATLIFLMLSG